MPLQIFLMLVRLRPSMFRPTAIFRSLVSVPPVKYIQSNEPTTSSPSEGTSNILNRPLSPHLTIYEPQLTWLMSIGHRVTGAALSTGIYAFGLYYALVDPVSITASAANWIAHDAPLALVVAGKYVLAAPFVYHTLNGIRHLVPKGQCFNFLCTRYGI